MPVVKTFLVNTSFSSSELWLLGHGAEQDDQLQGLESTVTSTKHIALAINGELDLHTRLLVSILPLSVMSCSLYTILLTQVIRGALMITRSMGVCISNCNAFDEVVVFLRRTSWTLMWS